MADISLNLPVNSVSSDRDRKPSTLSVPTDMSDIIARTTVEIKRLGWTDKLGREYLLKTYGKKSRSHLSDQELRGFLDYLESQPNPED